jgi:hypothetical protein
MKHPSLLLLAICAAIVSSPACGGGSGSSSSSTQPIAPSGTNVASISVNQGPAAADGFPYANGAFVTVTVCVPGTSTCQAINDVLVDTGSSGLRILNSAFTLSLPQENATDGDPIWECFPFVSGYTWGPVQTAEVQIAGETASSVPIELVGDTTYSVPSQCTGMGLPPSNTLDTLLANGILGVGLFAQDCGISSSPSCPASTDVYYDCPSATTCAPMTASAAQQLANPVTLFSTDNNGVIVELPAVSGAEASISGSLVFGISTESNNALGSATVYTADPTSGTFTTSFDNSSYPGSFIDSGSNGYFFLDESATGMPYCDATASAPEGNGFYCPANTQGFSATNQGTNGASGVVTFSIANANDLFSNSSDAVFGDLGGLFSGEFDWGLPFFYGQNVYVAIEGQSAPGGTAPYWAY